MCSNRTDVDDINNDAFLTGGLFENWKKRPKHYIRAFDGHRPGVPIVINTALSNRNPLIIISVRHSQFFLSRGKERKGNFNIQRSIKNLKRNNTYRFGDPGIIDEHIQPCDVLLHSIGSSSHLRLVCDVKRKLCDMYTCVNGPNGLLDRVQLTRSSSANDDMCYSTFCIPQSYGASNSSAGTSNENNFGRLGEVGFGRVDIMINIVVESIHEIESDVGW